MQSKKKFAPITWLIYGLFFKSIRFDQNCYINLFLDDLIQNIGIKSHDQSSTRRSSARILRPPLRQDWVVKRKDTKENSQTNVFFRRKNSDGYYFHSEYPKNLDRGIKSKFSSRQSTTLTKRGVTPTYFGINERPLAGFIFAPDMKYTSIIPQTRLLRDGGTCSRPTDCLTETSANSYFNDFFKNKYFSSHWQFCKALNKRENKTNETLARLRWDPEKIDAQAGCVFINSLEGRAIAQCYARLLRERLMTVYGGKKEDYAVPVVYYLPEDSDKNFTYYTDDEQERDRQESLKIYEEPITLGEKLLKKEIGFLLLLDDNYLSKLDNKYFNNQPIWVYLASLINQIYSDPSGSDYTFFVLLDRYLATYLKLPDDILTLITSDAEKYTRLMVVAILTRQKRVFNAFWQYTTLAKQINNTIPTLQIETLHIVIFIKAAIQSGGWAKIISDLLENVAGESFKMLTELLKKQDSEISTMTFFLEQENVRTILHNLFFNAVCINSVDIFRELLKYFFDEFKGLGQEKINKLLCMAVDQGFASIVEELLKEKEALELDINQRICMLELYEVQERGIGAENKTALDYALIRGDLPLCKMLIEKEARYSSGLFKWCINKKNPFSEIEFLFALKADGLINVKADLLYFMVENQRIDIVTYLLKTKSYEYSVLLEEKQFEGKKSLLLCTAKNGNVELFNLLLKCGVQLTKENADIKMDILCLMIQWQKTTMVKYLLINKNYEYAFLIINNQLTSEGKTALQNAVENDNAEAIKLLLEHGAKFETIDFKLRMNAFYSLLRNEDEAMLKNLLAEEAVDFLCFLVIHQQAPLVERLLKNEVYGCSSLLQENQLDRNKKMPLQYAKENNDVEMIDLLINYGAHNEENYFKLK